MNRLLTGCSIVTPSLTLAIVVLAASAARSQETEIVPVKAEWKYLSNDLGDPDPGEVDPQFDSTWFTPEFDDSMWEGPDPGPFAINEVDAFTDFFLEPLQLADSGDRFTVYARHEFETTEPLSNLAISFVADDGAVFYLDGQQVLRHNCCRTESGEIVSEGDDYKYLAITSGNDDDFRTRTILDGQTLAPGSHLLAVSAHNSSPESSDLGIGLSLVRDPEQLHDPAPFPSNAVVVSDGIDTFVAEMGQDGPDQPHGERPELEWDGSDGGGQNQTLIWFNIPPDTLDGFSGTAQLRLRASNSGNTGNLHRMTTDWLTGSAGGDEVTWNNVPGGPGVVAGKNAAETPTAETGEVGAGEFVTIDVTNDVLAWAQGSPNYGWAVLPTDTNGVRLISFENFASLASPADEISPLLLLSPSTVDQPLQAGDADRDFDFDQLDLVQVQIAAKYLTGQPATWGEGDWNGAPGGAQQNPPAGDGLFNQFDVIAAQQAAIYLTGPYAAIRNGGQRDDGQTSIVYDASTGEMAVDAPAGVELTSINVDSAAGIFTGQPAENLGGSFDNDADNNIFKATFGGSFGSISFGSVAQPQLSEDFLLNDLTVVGSLAGGGDLGDVDLVYIPVPEPASVLLAAFGFLALLPGVSRRRKRRAA